MNQAPALSLPTDFMLFCPSSITTRNNYRRLCRHFNALFFVRITIADFHFPPSAGIAEGYFADRMRVDGKIAWTKEAGSDTSPPQAPSFPS